MSILGVEQLVDAWPLALTGALVMLVGLIVGYRQGREDR